MTARHKWSPDAVDWVCAHCGVRCRTDGVRWGRRPRVGQQDVVGPGIASTWRILATCDLERRVAGPSPP
jgi:hypothetical protein